MTRRYLPITTTKLPEGYCPQCNARVIKAISAGRLSFVCRGLAKHIGDWERRTRTAPSPAQPEGKK